MWKNILIKSIAICIVASVIFPFNFTEGATVDELKKEISEKNSRVEELEREIAEFEKQVSTTAKEASSYQSAVNRLNTERKKLLSEISVTENKISAVQLTIDQISLGINDTESEIKKSVNTIANSIQSIQFIESQSFLEKVLTGESLSEVLDEIDSLSELQQNLRDRIRQLEESKNSLEEKHSETKRKKNELLVLKGKIVDQKSITESHKASQAKLLAIKKNQEAEYAKELARVKELKEAFERELLDLESQLKFEIDPSKIPTAGVKTLNLPLPDPTLESCWGAGSGFKNCLTQSFGKTTFSNGGAYNGEGHNGIDFRASVGTEIYAALSGVIEGTGDTDRQKGCYSYGKWVLIKHPNGLSTVYGHMSLVKVSTGQKVSTGDLIGYSGSTGYSTGPHLHFGVFASDGVKVLKLGDIKKSTRCSEISIPVADLRAYLNPLSYL